MNLTPDIYTTIYGFVYLCAAFLLLLFFADKQSLGFLDRSKAYAPFIGIVVLFLSYAVGQIAYIVLEGLIGMICPHYAYNAQDEIAIRMQAPEKLQEILRSAYVNLVTIRHLLLGSIFLGGSVALWRWKNDNKLAKVLIRACLIFAVCCGIAYWFLRIDFIKTQNQIRVAATKIQAEKSNVAQ